MWNVIWTMPNKITVYARPLFRLVCRPNEIMTIGSARMQIELRTHRYSDRDRYRCSCRYRCMGWCRYGYIGVDLLQPYVNYSILMSKLLLLLWCFAKLLPRCMRCAAWLRQGGRASVALLPWRCFTNSYKFIALHRTAAVDVGGERGFHLANAHFQCN